MITKTEAFLKDTFAASIYLQAHPTDRDYRLEHSIVWQISQRPLRKQRDFMCPML